MLSFLVGLGCGCFLGVLIMSCCKVSGQGNDCLECAFQTKEKLDNKDAEIRALEEMYKAELHARRTAQGLKRSYEDRLARLMMVKRINLKA